MDQLMVEKLASGTGEGAAAPHPQRRPRVREVSSRFMSPVAGDPFPTRSPLPKHQQGQGVSTPSPYLAERQRSSSVNRPRRHLDLEPFRCSDENRPARPESPLPPDQARKQRPVPVPVPFKENGGGGGKPQQHHLPKTCPGRVSNNAFTTPSRPDTPMVTASLDRTRIRQRSSNSNVSSATAATKLLQSTTEATSSDTNHTQITRRCLPDVRSSMPEADMLLPTVSSRQTTEKSCNRPNATVNGSDFSKFSASPCSRSLNLPPSSSEHLLFQSIKGSDKLESAFSKPYANAVKIGGLCLPPVPPCASAKPGSEIRKGKKVSSLREDAHSLRLLQNRYLQWRYANATAQASMLAQQRESERTHYSLALKITELYDSVKRKRIDLGVLQRTKTLSTILEAQIPYLDQWFSLQEDYSISLAEATQALLNASLRLPISSNVKANKQEVEEALNSAMEVMEKIVFHVQQSMPKAEETDHLISDLARVIGGERAFVEECGNLLSKTYTTQVEECSLRGHIIQLKQHY
ncbi:protein ENDOSPERM DEFECTIVE 1-like isoform X1 [Rosa rugosa]|uniref:protein ENDOSPERM DEFECTIVE 1-like isoform X1 n=1 Tax=Rosa rugosa TaxID=74645 RepID=UPI002B400D28|nr:protein ENDOSPERM DEFECTIVE 1-like isoform X1 [Rosa rugosa]